MAKNPQSRRQLVITTVHRLGVCTITQVLAEVGRMIDASTAMRCFESLRRQDIKSQHIKNQLAPSGTPTGKQVERGRRQLVAVILSKAARHGAIRRVGTGVYAPVAPHLHKPAAAS